MKKTLVLMLCLVSVFGIGEEPWGKDAALVRNSEKNYDEDTKCRTPMLGPVAEVLIRFHQKVISPADGPRSYHKPSSSQYTLDAMRKYGFMGGFLLGCDRLMRENEDPWIYPVVLDEAGDTFKWDPVK
ncbi:MAG: putative membrane protein insertion efficiency factor [Chlamydiae bacterium]|nr:putative membrane protein insertion efficiency factor [Chlamydiota bacterium]